MFKKTDTEETFIKVKKAVGKVKAEDVTGAIILIKTKKGGIVSSVGDMAEATIAIAEAVAETYKIEMAFRAGIEGGVKLREIREGKTTKLDAIRDVFSDLKALEEDLKSKLDAPEQSSKKAEKSAKTTEKDVDEMTDKLNDVLDKMLKDLGIR